MRNKAIILIGALVFSLFITGCGNKAAPERPAKDPAAEPKKALNSYLESLRDHDFEKMKQTVSYDVYKSWPTDPKLRDQVIEAQEKNIGTVKSWSFTSNPYVDEINNQAIIQTRLTTTKSFYVIDFDLRKQDKWRVFGAKVIKRTPIGQKKKPSSGAEVEDFDKVLKMLKDKMYHTQTK